MRRSHLAFAALALLAVPATLVVAENHGRQVRFVGVHPIPKTEGGGTCFIEGPHVHIYGADKVQYRMHEGANHFVGDPVAYGYDGPKYAYKGPHPIHVDADGDGQPEGDTEWCYLEGPHYHAFAAPEGPEFKVVGDTYFFVGEPPKAYFDARPAYVKINAIYTPMSYDRPQVVVEAPVGWVGMRADVIAPVLVAPGVEVVGPHVEVVAPSVEVHVPMPSVHIGIGIGAEVGGGVIIDERHGHHDNGLHRGHHK